MKIIKAIYKAPIIYKKYDSLFGATDIAIRYRDTIFKGSAILASEDEDFYSKKVGYNIALSKARIKCMKYYYGQEQEQYVQRKKYYREVLGYGQKTQQEVDPLGVFSKNLTHCKNRLTWFEEAIKKEQKLLNNYLKGQDKAIASIKAFRAKQKADDN